MNGKMGFRGACKTIVKSIVEVGYNCMKIGCSVKHEIRDAILWFHYI